MDGYGASGVREIILDTETTGLDPRAGHRIVEIGCLELVNHIPTDRNFHRYINPECDVPDEAVAVHGLTRELNTLPDRRGVYHCPMDDGSEIVLLAGYRALRPRRVIVGLTGCHFVTNGRTSRLGPSRGAAHLVRQLTALTGRT